MMDLRQYTTKEFAKVINEDVNVIMELMRNNRHLSYSNKPYNNVMQVVQNSTIKESNKTIVTKFIYTNLFNRPEHRFYDTKGYTITLK